MSSTHPVRLACQTCARRKVKCDRETPCKNCLKRGVPCTVVERRRRPRGRSVKQASSEVSSHLRELPNDGTLLPGSSQPMQGITVSTIAGETSKIQHQNLPEPRTWPLQRRKETFSPLPLHRSSPVSDSRNQELLDRSVDKVQNKEVAAEPGYTALSSPHVEKALLDIFLSQVDPIFRILHRPTLRAFLIKGRPYLNYRQGHLAPMALASAIFYVASSTLSEEQSRELFCESKETMVTKYKSETKSALMKLDFLTTKEMTVLQAFVLSLIAARLHDRSRRVWTMLSVALRIAQALSLHLVDPPFPIRPFEREMRCRLWHVIGWLDIEASIDRVSEPMMSSMWIQQHPLSDLRDEDFGFDSKEILQTTKGNLTDATLLKIVSQAQCILRSFDLSHFAEPGITDVCMRQQAVNIFRRDVDILLSCKTPTSAFHWFVMKLSDCIHDTLQLFALQPMQGETTGSAIRKPDIGMISVAGGILERRQTLFSDPRAQPWRWIETFFFPWHALAVALGEISTNPERSMVDRYWPVIETSYVQSLHLAVDTPPRLAGKSIEDLMIDAYAVRDSMTGNDTAAATCIWATGSPVTVASHNPSLECLLDWEQSVYSTI